MRSKSERRIGNELELHGIPYRYEPGIQFDVSWMEGVNGAAQGKYKNYFPDFLILTATGEYIVWEHLGRADLAGYRAVSPAGGPGVHEESGQRQQFLMKRLVSFMRNC